MITVSDFFDFFFLIFFFGLFFSDLLVHLIYQKPQLFAHSSFKVDQFGMKVFQVVLKDKGFN